MPEERKNAVTMRGNPMTLVGPELKVGAKAPPFTVLRPDLSPVRLEDSGGKVRLISVVPSVDTPVCDMQTKRLNEEAAKLRDVEILSVSMDLPFALNRWCGASGVERVTVTSDHRDASFGLAYGTLIKELRLLGRSIFVVDKGDTLRHVEYVRELTNHPDYDAALAAVRAAAGA